MKTFTAFALLAACLMATAAAAAKEEEELTAEQELATEDELAAEEEEDRAEEETMDEEERSHLFRCRQSCDPLYSRCIRAPFYSSRLVYPLTHSYASYAPITYPAYRYSCVTRRVIRTVVSPCRRTCYAQYGYGYPGCMQQCAPLPATLHQVAEPHQVSTAATFFPNYAQCRTVCPQRCFMAHRGFFRCGLLSGY